jgi:CBS domain-containing protein
MNDAPTLEVASSLTGSPPFADVMRPALTTVEPDAHLAAAAYLMKHAGASALVILDTEQDKLPLGLITEADIVAAVAEGKDVNDVRIRDLMTSDLTFSTAATTIRDGTESMIAGRFRHLPVLDHGSLVGIVDIEDLRAQVLQPAAPARDRAVDTTR